MVRNLVQTSKSIFIAHFNIVPLVVTY